MTVDDYTPEFQDMSNVVAMDYETFLMGAQNLAPKGICMSLAVMDRVATTDMDTREVTYKETVETHLISDGDDNWDEYTKYLIDDAVADDSMIITAHNAKFDMLVLVSDHPDYYDKVCLLYDRGQIHCTVLMEKLMNLTTTGYVSHLPKNAGEVKGRAISYALSSLVKEYLGIDIVEDKEKADAVRLRYQELSGIKASRYPKEFRDYAINDSEYLIRIYSLMLQKREEVWKNLKIDPFRTLAHRCSLDFHMGRMSQVGVRTNPKQIKVLEDMLSVELSEERLHLLYPSETLSDEEYNDLDKLDRHLTEILPKSVLVPAQPVRISYRVSHAKDCDKVDCLSGCFFKEAKVHEAECKRKSDKFTRQWLCDCPPKYIAEQKASSNTKVIKLHVLDLWKESPEHYDLMFSDTTTNKKGDFLIPEMNDYLLFKDGKVTVEVAYQSLLNNIAKISVKKEWLDLYAFRDPLLSQFAHRASLNKLQTTELPRMKNHDGSIAEVVHGNFDVLKETGRTSGYASKLYPSANLQNVHKMARTCFKAREGHWILAVDYAGLEFLSAAQRSLDLLGESVYAEVINSGGDSHSYLAAQRAVRSEIWFRTIVEAKGITLDQHRLVYEEFMLYKKEDKLLGMYEGQVDDQGKEIPKYFWSHYRGSAKPVGLGLLGGMGAKTIARISAAQYKIDMTEDEAKDYKKIWEEIFWPEAKLLKMVNSDMKDLDFSTREHKKFKYTTPMGMYRPNCSYTSCANGSILQSPSAEGATLGVIDLVKQTFMSNSTSILKGNYFPWAFIHDENVGDVVADVVIANKVKDEVERIMCEALKGAFPDLNPTVDSTLMEVWNKKAKETYNKDGLLVPHECREDKELALKCNM